MSAQSHPTRTPRRLGRLTIDYLLSTRELLVSGWSGRRLLIALARRDISDEHVSQGSAAAWSIVQPAVMIVVYFVVFTFVFPTRVAAPPSSSTDAVVYLLAGIIPWITLSHAMSRALVSVVGNASIVKQMVFPLEFLPLKALAGPALSGGVLLAILVGYSLYITRGASLPAYLIGLPVLIAMTLAFMAGLALMLACIQVFVRDCREIVNIFLTAGLFVHPILYLPSAVPAVVKPILYASPLTYLLFCWQDVLFYCTLERPIAWLVAFAFAATFLIIGSRLFLVSRPHFGDFL